jgi:hypothetical protein
MMLSGDVTNLTVSNKNDLGGRALLVVGSNSLDNSSSSLRGGVVVADATAVRLSTASWVDDGLCASTRVRTLDLVYKSGSSAEPIALRQSSLASAKDVDLGAGLPLSKVDGASGGEAGEESSCGSDLHCAKR